LTGKSRLLASAALMKKVIATNDAPAAVGPYSQAIAFGNLLFCAGQIPLDPVTGDLVGEDVTAQTERVCQNIAGVLKANGMTFGNVVKTTVFLTDLANFAAMNAVYSKYFTEPFPARSTIQVAGLPRGSQVEIEVTAAAGE
jgi:2-iminobutanoate/2-iminopropanoate deaminase